MLLVFWPPTAPKSQLPLRFYRPLPLKGGAMAPKALKVFFLSEGGVSPQVGSYKANLKLQKILLAS